MGSNGASAPLQVLNRHVAQAGLLVVQGQVTVRERPALGVLTGEADVGSLGQQRGERQALGMAELDLALLELVDAGEQRLAQLAMDREAVGHPQQLLVERAQALLRDRRLDLRAARSVELAGAERGRARVLVLARLHLVRSRFSVVWSCSWDRFASLSTSSAVTTPSSISLRVQLGDGRVLLDLRRHRRLRVGGLVRLVVAVAAIADQVDDHVSPHCSR